MKKRAVYIISMLTSLIIVMLAGKFPKEFTIVSNVLLNIIKANFSWFYLFIMLIFAVFVVIIAFSKYGNIKLGEDNTKPEYSTKSWFAMLFCAGMGVGLVFWGISEPLNHYINPLRATPGSVEAIEDSFTAVFMHWGIHPWSCYAIVGLALAYFQFRKGKRMLISSTLTDFFPAKASVFFGTFVDVLSAFATIAGVVTSLGLGVMQINGGLYKLFNIQQNIFTQIVIIIIITCIFLISAMSGVEKGIKILSNVNVYIAIIFLLVSFSAAPKVEVLNNMVNGIGCYIGGFFENSLAINTYTDNNWIESWRVFYWAWWIAWTPFVGVFIARISKGRTIREFILGVVIAPTLASIVWFSVFGTMGISLAVKGTLTESNLEAIINNPELGLFMVMEHYPMGKFLSILAIILLCVFFVTSADSGTYVLSMISANGDLNSSNRIKLVWGVVVSVMSIVLLIAGGLTALQTLSIIAAFPFAIVMLLTGVSLLKEIRKEKV